MSKSKRSLTFWQECQCLAGGIATGLFRAAGLRSGMITRFTEVLVEPHLEKAISKMKPIGRVPSFPIAGIRPWKFKEGVSEEMLNDDAVVLVRQIKGKGVEATVKDRRFVKLVSMRGEKVDLLDGVPELRDAILPETVANGKFYFEIRSRDGEAFTEDLLHASKEAAAATVEDHGHPEVFVLAVHKLNGRDTSKLPFAEMRELTELVARAIPHGKLPEIAETTDAKHALKDAVWSENESDEVEAETDGILAMSITEPNKGMKIHQDKPPRTYNLVVMGFEEPESGKGVTSLVLGDGTDRLGKVTVAREDLRIAIQQNPDRWLNKVVTLVGEQKSNLKAGNGSLPDLGPKKYWVRWDLDPSDVFPKKSVDPEEAREPALATT